MAKPSGRFKSKAATGIFSGLALKRPVITFHSLGDLDAVGSAIALKRFLGKKAVIAPPDRPNSSARKLLSYTQTPTTLFSDLSLSQHDAIIVLDSSSPHLLAHLAGIKPDILIDHHGKFGGEVSAKKEISDPAASSTCEMLHFMLHAADRISCLSLLLGIISDSAYFKSATPRTFEAAAALLERSGLPYSQIASLAAAPETFDERVESLRSCQSVTADRIGQCIVATAMAKSHEAHFADALVHIGADIAFVGCAGEESRISARMRETLKGRVRLDRIMFEVGKVLGGSGSGHELAAGASGSRENPRAALGICVKLAEQQLLATERSKIRRIEW